MVLFYTETQKATFAKLCFKLENLLNLEISEFF